jgi:hypothetical protein
MEDAPPAVHALLSELCYVCWLLGRGELATARHHTAEAQRKAKEISRLLRGWRRQEIRREASILRHRSWQLQQRTKDLQERSELLIAQSATLRRRRAASSEAAPTQEETPDAELVLA